MGPDPVECGVGGWGFGEIVSPGELQLPAAHLAEAFDEGTGILGGQFFRLVAELAETGLETAGGGEAVAVVFGVAAEEFTTDPGPAHGCRDLRNARGRAIRTRLRCSAVPLVCPGF